MQDEALVVTSCEGRGVTSPQEVNGIRALKIGFSLALPPVRFTLCAEIGQKPVLLHPVVNEDFPVPCCEKRLFTHPGPGSGLDENWKNLRNVVRVLSVPSHPDENLKHNVYI